MWLRHKVYSGLDDILPSEIYRQNMYLCMIEEPVCLKYRDDIGVDKIMWECDYPHTDTTWPDVAVDDAGSARGGRRHRRGGRARSPTATPNASSTGRWPRLTCWPVPHRRDRSPAGSPGPGQKHLAAGRRGGGGPTRRRRGRAAASPPCGLQRAAAPRHWRGRPLVARRPRRAPTASPVGCVTMAPVRPSWWKHAPPSVTTGSCIAG